jgi:mannose-1-phosphate guanylyltransferase
MFIWKVSTILENLKQYLPETYEGLCRIQAAIGTAEEQAVLEKEFSAFRSESIDYGVMEKAKHIYILSGSFGWDDVGSWLAVGRLKQSNEFGNVVNGNVVTVDTKDSIIQGENKLIATVGVNDLIVVDTTDAILICRKNSAGSIKKVLENLKICNRTEYL